MTRPAEAPRGHPPRDRPTNAVVNQRIREGILDSLANPRRGGTLEVETNADATQPLTEAEANREMNQAIREGSRQLRGILTDE